MDNTFGVPVTDASLGGNPLEVHGKALLHEVVAGPKLEWSWGAKVEVKNVSEKSIVLMFATLTELGRHPESGHRGGLGDGRHMSSARTGSFRILRFAPRTRSLCGIQNLES